MWWLRLAGQSTCIGKVCSFYINSILSNLSFSSDQPPIYNRTSLLTLKKEKTKNKTKILCFTWCISLYTLQLFYLFIYFKKYTPTIVIFFFIWTSPTRVIKWCVWFFYLPKKKKCLIFFFLYHILVDYCIKMKKRMWHIRMDETEKCIQAGTEYFYYTQ